MPKPIAVHKNILAMEYIGHNEVSLPIEQQGPENPEAFYEMLISNIRKLYQDAKLIHADLSQFNILNHDEKPVLIDFSHAIDLRYPDSRSMLERDIRIVCTYFNKLGMKLDYMEEVQKVMK